MLKRLALSLVTLLAAAPLLAQISGAMMTLQSGNEQVPAYISAPNDAVRKPGVVIIQEWWGLNDFVRSKTDYFARQGYVAIAPDLYRGGIATDANTAHQLMRGLPEDRALRDLKAAATLLMGRADVDPARVGVVGWCMGGGYALRLSLAEDKLAGAVLYYGALVTDDAAIQSLKVPLLGNFGGKDEGIPAASVREFEKKAKAAGKSVDFKIYPEAGHGFASSRDPKEFRAADAKDADARTDAFFKRVFAKGKKPAAKKPVAKPAAKPAAKPS